MASPSIIADWQGRLAAARTIEGYRLVQSYPLRVRTRACPPLKQHLAAIAIVLDFVNPVVALWRLFDRGSELRRDKAKVGYAGHATESSVPLENCESVNLAYWALMLLQQRGRTNETVTAV